MHMFEPQQVKSARNPITLTFSPMNSSMEAYKNGYYAQNCHPERFTWFDSWEYPAYVSHAFSVFLIPLNVFGGYCILFKTPKKMENAKWIMLNLHFWTSLLDVLFSSLLTPYFFFPGMCGFSVGIFNWIGLHPIFQVFFAQITLGALGVSLVVIFENRQNVVATDKYVITGKKSRMTFYALNYTYGCFFMLPTYFMIPDQEKTLLDILKTVPCPTPYFFEPNTFALMNDEGRFWIQAQCTTFFWILVLEGTFFVTRTVYFLTAKNPSLSEKTRQMQKKFFRSVCIQVAIPVLVVVVPIAYCGITIQIYWYNQALTNTAIICVTLHGMSSTLAVIFIYEPYRTFTKKLIQKLFCKKTSTSPTPLVTVTPKTSRSVPVWKTNSI